MKKKDLVNLFNGLYAVGGISGQKFSYAIARNIDILKPEIDKFNQAKDAIIKSFSKKDTEGKPLKDDKGFIIENQEEADKEYKALLEEDTDLTLFKINVSQVPETITGSQFSGIYPIITE